MIQHGGPSGAAPPGAGPAGKLEVFDDPEALARGAADLLVATAEQSG